ADAQLIAACSVALTEEKARVQSLLAIKAIFGDDLPDNSLFTAKVTEAYLSLLAHGAKATVAKYSVK
ncbi:hypothetical protein ACUOCP_47790, partial [Escherichia sp. R-CC3]